MKQWFLSTLLFITGCVYNVRVVKEDEGVSQKTTQRLHKMKEQLAVVSVGPYRIPCKIMGVDDHRLVIADLEIIRELPILAVSKIEPYESSVNFSSLAGYTLAGLTGGFLGHLAAQKAVPSGDNAGEARIAAASAGAALGMVVMHGFSYNEDNVVLNPNLKLFEIIPGSSSPIKSTTIQQNGLFQDLNLNAGETLTQMRIYQYDTGKYIMMYEVHNSQALTLRWKIVEEDYITREKQRLNLPLKEQIFKGSALKSE